jgi:hypothetical protein
MKNPRLRTDNSIPEALSNLCYRCSVVDIEDAVEESQTGTELLAKLNKLSLHRKFTLDRETDTKVRLKVIDTFGNVSYFEATKEPKVEKEKQLAIHITNTLNGSFDNKAFVEQMSIEHRTLQSEFTSLCLDWLLKCREMYEDDRYDGRNELSCKSGKVLMDYLEKGDF